VLLPILLTLFQGRLGNLLPQVEGILSRALKELFGSIVGGEVVTDEASYVDFAGPGTGLKAFPGLILISHNPTPYLSQLDSENKSGFTRINISHSPLKFNIRKDFLIHRK
jgi:hypothetical protein